MMRILKAIITPLILFSIALSPLSVNIAKAQPQNEAECKAAGGTWTTRSGSSFCLGSTLSETGRINTPSETGGSQDGCDGQWISDPNFEDGGYCSTKAESAKGGSEFSKVLAGANLRDQTINSCSIKWPGDGISGIVTSGAGLLITNIAISGLNGAPIVGGLVEPFDDALDQLNSAWLSALTWGTAASLSMFVSAYLIQVGFVLNGHITADNPVVKEGFNITLSIVNITFVILLVVIGIMTILRRSDWAAQKRIGNLIVAIILINFSIYFAGLLLNISNVFTNALLGNSCASELFNKLNVAAIFEMVQPIIGGNSLNPLTSSAALIISAIFTIISALTLFALFLFLVIRYVVIVLLLVFMPIAWLGFVAPEIKIPGFGNPWNKWWEEFMRWITVGPIMAFSLYLTINVLQNISQTVDASLNPKTTLVITAVAANASSSLLGILNIFTALIMSLLGLYVAVKGSGLASTLIAGGLATGTAFAAKGIQSLGGRIGFGGQIRAEEKAKQLRKQAEEAEKAGQTGKAQSLRMRAAAAEKLAAGAGAVGKGTAVTPAGLGFGLGGKLLEQAGVKGIKPSGEIRTAQAWREAEVKRVAARYASMSEDQRKQEIAGITKELDGPVMPGRKVELYNRYAALAQSMAKEGKLDEEITKRVLRSDFQKQASIMGVKIDFEETAKKLPVDQLVSRLKTLNTIKSEKGIDNKAAEKMQVEALRQLESSNKLDMLSDTELMRAAYSLKSDIEKKGGNFKKYELAFGMDADTGKALTELVILKQQEPEIGRKIHALDAQIAANTTLNTHNALAENSRLQPEVDRLRALETSIASAETTALHQAGNWADWVSKLKPEEIKKLPLDKIFGSGTVDEMDAGLTEDFRNTLAEAVAKNNPSEALKFMNVKTQNYETAAKSMHSAIGRRKFDPSISATEGGILNNTEAAIVAAARRKGVTL